MKRCLAICLVCSFVAALLPSAVESRLRSRLFSNSWVSRANAAVLLADNPHAIPWLVDALDDPMSRVRLNVRWALHQLTGLPWASQEAACRQWAAGGPAPVTESPGGQNPLGLQLEMPEPGTLRATVSNGSGADVALFASPGEDYTAILYAPDGRMARVIDAEEPESAIVEVFISDISGAGLARYWTRLDGRGLRAGVNDLGDGYDLSWLPPGLYVATARMGSGLVRLPAADGDLFSFSRERFPTMESRFVFRR